MTKLHAQLEKDTILLGEFSLCWLLLMDDANYPWFILVPKRDHITEIHQLSEADQQQLLAESMLLCRCLEQVFHPDKLNIAALGNIVPQLHIHHIVRFKTDACWPSPVWGAVEAIPLNSSAIDSIRQQLLDWLAKHGDHVGRHDGTALAFYPA